MPEPINSNAAPETRLSDKDLFRTWIDSGFDAVENALQTVWDRLNLGEGLPPSWTANAVATAIRNHFDARQKRAIEARETELNNTYRQRIQEAREAGINVGRDASTRELTRRLAEVAGIGSYVSLDHLFDSIQSRLDEKTIPESFWPGRVLYAVVGSRYSSFENYYSTWVVTTYLNEDDAIEHADLASSRAGEINTLLQDLDYDGPFINEYDPNRDVGLEGIVYEVQPTSYTRGTNKVPEGQQTSVWEQLIED